MKAVLIVLLAALTVAGTVACATRADGPPDIVVDRSTCSHCGMLISERIYAAALQSPDGRAQVFDDIGCLLAAVRPSFPGGARVWFHDAGDGQWMAGPAAVFVVSPALRTPMGGGIIAYRDRSAADRAAAQHQGTVVTSVDALLARKGGRP